MDFRVLGPLEVVGPAGVIPIPSGKQRALLAVLILDRGQAVGRARLIDELWASRRRPPPTMRCRSISRVSASGLGPICVETRAGGYRLAMVDATTDLARFERLVRDGQIALEAGEPAAAADRYDEALGLWRGPALADLDGEPAASAERTRLDELRVVVFEHAIDAKLAAGGHLDVIPDLHRAIAADPLREGAYVRLMLASYRAGRQSDALDAFHRARTILRSELGVEPGPALEAMQRAVLAHDPALRGDTPPARTAAVEPAGGSTVTDRPAASRTTREIILTASDRWGLDDVIAPALDLVRDGDRGLILARLVDPAPDALEAAVAELRTSRADVRQLGVKIRTAAFTTRAWGRDLALLASRASADLVVVGGVTPMPAGPFERSLSDLFTLGAVDVALALTVDRRTTGGAAADASIVVPFGGSSHDWAALELGALVRPSPPDQASSSRETMAKRRSTGATTVPTVGASSRSTATPRSIRMNRSCTSATTGPMRTTLARLALPTEFEWEHAAQCTPPGTLRELDTVAWQWTSSADSPIRAFGPRPEPSANTTGVHERAR